MSTTVHRQALEDLKTIARHMYELANSDCGVEDLVKLKTIIRLYNAKAYQTQRDAIMNIEVLFDAIEHGISLEDLIDYDEFVALRDDENDYAESA